MNLCGYAFLPLTPNLLPLLILNIAEGFSKTLARMDPQVAKAMGVKIVPGKLPTVPGVQVRFDTL